MRGPRASTEKRRARRLPLVVALAVAALCVESCAAPPPAPPSPRPSPAERAAEAPNGLASGSLPAASDARPEETEAHQAEAQDGWSKPFHSDETFDLAIRGGEVVTGTGAPPRRADVLVRGDVIAHVGVLDPSVRAKRELDATGAVVTPGFVDAHSHADPIRSAPLLLAQGVTTIVVGQDGRSPGDGGSIRAYLASVEAKRPVVNVATLVGHASVRVRANVGVARPGPDALARMEGLVADGLDEGALGLSTGLEYDPARLAEAAELTAVARPVGARGGLVMSHLRSEDDAEIEAALAELIAQGRSAGARVHVAHLKVVGGHGAARAEAILRSFDAARASGVEVTADWYPYTASYTGLEILFPDFARPPHDYEGAKRRRGPALRAYLRERVAGRNGPEATLFGTGVVAGKTLAAVAAERGVPFEEVLVDLGPRGASAAYFVMDDALQSRLFADPHVMVGSDGGGGGGHPRGAGSFARVIEEFVGKRAQMPLGEAVRRMTHLPLSTLRLEGRGLVRAGQAADLLVFVPSEVHERASFTIPHRPAVGMRAVIVAGEVVAQGGRTTSARPGRVLRAPWTKPL